MRQDSYLLQFFKSTMESLPFIRTANQRLIERTSVSSIGSEAWLYIKGIFLSNVDVSLM